MSNEPLEYLLTDLYALRGSLKAKTELVMHEHKLELALKLQLATDAVSDAIVSLEKEQQQNHNKTQ